MDEVIGYVEYILCLNCCDFSDKARGEAIYKSLEIKHCHDCGIKLPAFDNCPHCEARDNEIHEAYELALRASGVSPKQIKEIINRAKSNTIFNLAISAKLKNSGSCKCIIKLHDLSFNLC